MGRLHNNIEKEKMVNKMIDPEVHPTHYLMHKYWGRKPHNVINEYIAHYTKEGDLVLDPFMGSGGVIIESKKLNRRSIGVDLNPLSIFIVENTLSIIELGELRNIFQTILNSIPKKVLDLTYTKCPDCLNLCPIDNAVWAGEELKRIKSRCDTHGVFRKDADDFDLIQLTQASKLLKEYEKEGLFYPTDKMLDYVKRSGKTNINQLFSHRNLLICSLIFREIEHIKEDNLRKCMRMVFNSMLPNVSNMIPADIKNVTGKSGWQISKFWVPKVHTEKNVMDSFKLRFDKIIKGKKEIQSLLSKADHKLYNANAENMPFIENDSIDYIFTDPPYGESISYFGLSMFWNSWSKATVDYEQEIIYDPYRNKGHEDYKNRLENAYKEMYRVLKPGKYLSFTFHNRNLKFWKTIIDACLDAGFDLTHIVWQSQAVSSGTQGINRKNTLKGDFVYNFTKPLKPVEKISEKDVDGESFVLEETEKLFKTADFIETTRLYEHLIPLIVKKRAFLDSKGQILDIDILLGKYYKYNQLSDEGVIKYGWIKK